MASMITGVHALPETESIKDGPSKPLQEPAIEKIEQVTIPEEKPLEIVAVQPQPLTGCDAVRAEVAKYNGWDVATITAIAQAESSCRVDALGDTALKYSQNGREYGYSVGVLQVRILPGREHCEGFNLETNVACAHKIWQSQGYKAWTCFTNGKYLRFM